MNGSRLLESNAILIFGFACLFCLIGCGRILGGRVEVSMVNQQRDAIHDVQLRFNGAGTKVGVIEPGQHKVEIISPNNGGTGLSFWYTDASGKEHEMPIGVYWTGRDRCQLEIAVEPGGELSCRKNGGPKMNASAGGSVSLFSPSEAASPPTP